MGSSIRTGEALTSSSDSDHRRNLDPVISLPGLGSDYSRCHDNMPAVLFGDACFYTRCKNATPISA